MKEFLKKHWILLTILLLSALFRYLGVKPGVYLYHPDEPIIHGTAIDMVNNKTLDPLRFDYPGLAIYINYFSFKFFFIPITWLIYFLERIPQIVDGTLHIPIAPLEAERTMQTFIFGIRGINAISWGRYIIATFSVGNVFLAYILGKKLFGKEAGLIAAFFLALNFRQILNSHLNLPDIYNAFFLLLSIITSYNLLEKPIKKNYLIAGITAGLSFATKYQVFAIIPLAMAHLYVSIADRRETIRRLFNPVVLVAVVAFMLTFLITNPYFLIKIEVALEWITVVSHKYGMGINKLSLYPFWYMLHVDYGPLQFLLVILGMAVSFVLYPKKTTPLILVIFAFFFSLIYLSRGGFYVRNFVTITPIMFVLASGGLSKIYKNLFPLSLLIFLLAVIVPSKNSIINTYYETKEWNYNVASRWLFANIKPGTIIASNPFDPPTGLPEVVKTEFESYGNYSISEHGDAGAEYAMVNLEWAGNPFYSWMTFGVDDLGYVFRKPVDEMRNTFYGIAIEELLQYQVFAVTKPWQAPDANIIVSKIPLWPTTKMTEKQNFSFEGNLEDWRIYGRYGDIDNVDYIFDAEVGSTKPGSIAFISGSAKYPTVRITSEAIDIKPGKLYKVTSYIKSRDILSANNRDGFMRVDFYNDRSDLNTVGIVSLVSSRVFGDSRWVKKEIIYRAPSESKYLTVSFQVNDLGKNKIWIDDVTVEESEEEVEDILGKSPYNYKEIDLDLLYPNSHGNF